MKAPVHLPVLINAAAAGGAPLLVDGAAWLAQADEAALAAVVPLPGRPGALLCLAAPSVQVRVNGQRAPRCVQLAERDELTLARAGTHLRFHVSIRLAAAIQPAPAGRSCALCRTPINPGSPSYACVCGALLHAGDVACAHTSPDCPRCLQSIRLSAGTEYSYWPEDLS